MILQRHPFDKSRTRRVKYLDDYCMNTDMMTDYSLEKLVECRSNEGKVVFLIQDYE